MYSSAASDVPAVVCSFSAGIHGGGSWRRNDRQFMTENNCIRCTSPCLTDGLLLSASSRMIAKDASSIKISAQPEAGRGNGAGMEGERIITTQLEKAEL
jgi:hypothetical protein